MPKEEGRRVAGPEACFLQASGGCDSVGRSFLLHGE